MNFRYLSLFIVLSICMPVGGAHFARRCAQFARQYPGPLAGTGMGVSCYFYMRFLQKELIVAGLVEEKRQEELRLINPEIKQFIRNECARHGWKPDFIIFESAEHFNNNIVTVSDGTKTGLLVGSGWGLSAQESGSFFSIEACRFAIGHESTHARYHDPVGKVKVGVLDSFFSGLVWHVVRASGRGKAFSLLTSFVGGIVVNQTFFNAPFNKWKEFRADKESVNCAPENVDGGIQYLGPDAQKEAERLRVISAVINGQATEEEKNQFWQNFNLQFGRVISHPPSIERIKRLEAMKNASSNKS